MRSNYHNIILHPNQKSKFEISISWSVSILFSTFKDQTPLNYIIGCYWSKQNGRRIESIGPMVATSCRILHFFSIFTLDCLVSSFLEYRLVQNHINTIIISVLQAFYTYFYVVVGMIWSTGINTSWFLFWFYSTPKFGLYRTVLILCLCLWKRRRFKAWRTYDDTDDTGMFLGLKRDEWITKSLFLMIKSSS